MESYSSTHMYKIRFNNISKSTWRLEWSTERHCWHCCQRMEKECVYVFAKRGHPERVRAAAIAYVRPCWPPFYSRIDRHVCTLILLSKQMSWWSAVSIWLTDNSCQYNYEYCVFLPSGKAVMLQFLFNTFAQNIKVGQCLFKLQLNSRQFFYVKYV